MQNLKVDMVIIGKQGEQSENYKEFLEIAKNKKIKVAQVKAGDKIQIDENTSISILFPTENLINENILNNNSLVAKFTYAMDGTKEFSMLLTGDIEEIAEDEIVSIYRNTNELKANILKIAHHGSKTSTTQDFLNLVKPQIALIGVGANNSFGHPNKVTLDKLNNLGTKIFRTDLSGEITITVTKKRDCKDKTTIGVGLLKLQLKIVAKY